jgi:Tol biopolymer transport system component
VGLWTSAPDGSDLHQVVPGQRWFSQGVLLAGWHPNGKDLVYALTGIYGSSLPQWLTIPAGGGNPQFLPLAGRLYDISPDGTWLLGEGYTRTAPVGRREFSYNVLMRIPADGKAPTVLTPACRSDIEGAISPDGSRIAFLSLPSLASACPRPSGQVKYELWVMNSDGSGRTQLNVKGVIGRDSPQWSADGQVVYYSILGPKGPELWKADASGAIPPEQLPNAIGAERFAVVH